MAILAFGKFALISGIERPSGGTAKNNRASWDPSLARLSPSDVQAQDFSVFWSTLIICWVYINIYNE